MCEPQNRERRSPAGFLRIALQPGVPFGRRMREIGVNLSRRYRDGGFHDCCGNYGEPGC